MCIGEETYQCTKCLPGRTLVPANNETTDHGYCAANSVVKNEMLQKEVLAEAREISELKAGHEHISPKVVPKSKQLNVASAFSTKDLSLGDMEAASKEISDQALSIEKMEKSAMEATEEMSDKTELGEEDSDLQKDKHENDENDSDVYSLDVDALSPY